MRPPVQILEAGHHEALWDKGGIETHELLWVARSRVVGV